VRRAGVDELLEPLLGRGLRLTDDLSGLLVLDTEVGLGLVEAHSGRGVEGLVSTTAHAVGDADDDLLARSGRARAAGGGGAVARGGVVVAAAAGRQAQRGSRDDRRDLGCVTQGLLLMFRRADDDIGPDARNCRPRRHKI
jgi:hypothetical protein